MKAVPADGQRLYLSNGDAGTESILDAGTGTHGATLVVGRIRKAANSLSNTLSVIDTKTLRIVKTIKTGDGPWALAVR